LIARLFTGIENLFTKCQATSSLQILLPEQAYPPMLPLRDKTGAPEFDS